MSNADIARYSKRFVQLFWDPQPANDLTPTAPIWCLGRRYDPRPLFHEPAPTVPPVASTPPSLKSADISPQHQQPLPQTPKSKPLLEARTNSTGFEHVHKEDVANASAINGIDDGWPSDFLDDFECKIWLTYRSNFPPIPKSQDPDASAAMSFSVRLRSQLSNQSGFTSDTGWGCMIRSGQSLLANALVLLKLGRDWRRSLDHQHDECNILGLFADDPKAPFSVHRFVEHGAAACGTYPGQWFGPSATSQCIEALCNTYEDAGLRVYVTGDGTDVFEDKLFQIAKDEAGNFRPTLLLVGTRLGIDRVTPVYQDALIASLMMPQTVGIAGGRPSSSHYFVGAQSRTLFYLDPHQTRPALPFHSDSAAYTEEEIASCHTRRLRRLPIEEMDPSMLIAFLFQCEDDWTAWRTAVAQAPGKHIFHVRDSAASSDAGGGGGVERESAVDEVETLDDCEERGVDGDDGARSEGWVEADGDADAMDGVQSHDEGSGSSSSASVSASASKELGKVDGITSTASH